MEQKFAIRDKVAVITGGGGIICGVLAEQMAFCGAKIAVLDRSSQAAQHTADRICSTGGQAIAIVCDVLERESIQRAADAVMNRWGIADILINGAGGNHPKATTGPDCSFFDL